MPKSVPNQAFIRLCKRPPKKSRRYLSTGQSSSLEFTKQIPSSVNAAERSKSSPLSCTRAEIRRVLIRIGWPTEIPKFDPSYDLPDPDVCQLTPWTEDGFSRDDVQTQSEGGPDPPFIENYSDPHCWDDHCD